MMCFVFCWPSGRRGTGGRNQKIWGSGVSAAGEGEQPGGGKRNHEPTASPRESGVPQRRGQEEGDTWLTVFQWTTMKAMNSIKSQLPKKSSVFWRQSASLHLSRAFIVSFPHLINQVFSQLSETLCGIIRACLKDCVCAVSFRRRCLLWRARPTSSAYRRLRSVNGCSVTGASRCRCSRRYVEGKKIYNTE